MPDLFQFGLRCFNILCLELKTIMTLFNYYEGSYKKTNKIPFIHIANTR